MWVRSCGKTYRPSSDNGISIKQTQIALHVQFTLSVSSERLTSGTRAKRGQKEGKNRAKIEQISDVVNTSPLSHIPMIDMSSRAQALTNVIAKNILVTGRPRAPRFGGTFEIAGHGDVHIIRGTHVRVRGTGFQYRGEIVRRNVRTHRGNRRTGDVFVVGIVQQMIWTAFHLSNTRSVVDMQHPLTVGQRGTTRNGRCACLCVFTAHHVRKIGLLGRQEL